MTYTGADHRIPQVVSNKIHAEWARWTVVSSNGFRRVRTDTLRTVRPSVTFLSAFGSPGVNAPAEQRTEVNCDTRIRRSEGPIRAATWRPLDGTFFSVDSFGPEWREEIDYVCAWARRQWEAGVPSSEEARPDGAPSLPAPATALAPEPTLPAPQPSPPPTKKAPTASSTGSGFFISPGQVVTNDHVVEDCQHIFVQFKGHTAQATLVARAARSDLTLLNAAHIGVTPVSLRTTAALGEDVTVAGYPLDGLLSWDLIVTSGQVNSMAGLRNDPSTLQVSAPVQPGNSGGPLLDRSGSVVGVVVSKLNAEKVARVTGDWAQNVNFAIKPEVLRLFLDTNRVQYRTAAIGLRLDGIVLAERARQFTVKVLCEK